jgi:NADP-dependent 3-hydroxy acid dehydrogenase YdfG
MSESCRQEGLRVIVTGAGSGVGFACASAFASRGAELIIADNDHEKLSEAGGTLGAYSRFCDVVSASSSALFATEIEQDFDGVDVLINAAGNGYIRALGMVRMVTALLPLLSKGAGARLIVNVASCCARPAAHRLFPHGGSQRSFDQLSDAIAAQVRGSSIAVAAVKPTRRPEDLAERIVAMVCALYPGWAGCMEEVRRRA